MAKKKKGFLLYADMIEQFDLLTDSQAGVLIKTILIYAGGDEPEITDPFIAFAFAGIKTTLDRDKQSWLETLDARSRAGKASAEARKKKKEQGSTKSTRVKSVKHTSTNSTDSDSVSDSENDSVSETITPKPPRGIHSLHRRILLLFVSSVSDKPRPKAEMNAWNKIKDHVTEQDVESLERFYALPKSKDHDATWNRKTAAPQLMNQFTAQLEFAENYKVQSNSSYYDDSKIL